MSVTTVNRDAKLLHPKFRTPLLDLLEYLDLAYKAGGTQSCFKLFEGFRLPDRQAHLLKVGTTKAGMWESAHQFGLAADLVPFHDNRWSWSADHDYDFLKRAARTFQLDTPLAWDRVHVQSPYWPHVRQALR